MTQDPSSDPVGQELLQAINRTYPRDPPGVVLGRAWLAVAQALAGAQAGIAQIAYAFYGMTRTPARDRDVPAYVVATDRALLILVSVTWSTDVPSLPETFDTTEAPLSSIGLHLHRGMFLDRVTITYGEPIGTPQRQMILRRVAHRPELAGLLALISEQRAGAEVPGTDDL